MDSPNSGQPEGPGGGYQLPTPSDPAYPIDWSRVVTTPPPPIGAGAATPAPVAEPTRAAKPPPHLQDSTPPPPIGMPAGASTTPPPKRVGKPPSTLLDLGPEALPKIAWGVDGAESGHVHVDPETGKPKVSGKGAVGRMGLEPGSFPGINVQDEQANLAAGRNELQRLYKQYKNWPDALIGYNWGEGNLKKWIAEGRPADALPAETKKYLQTVAGGMGVTPGLMFQERKDKLSAEDSQELLREQDTLLGRTPQDDEGGPLVSDEPRGPGPEFRVEGLIGQDAVNQISAFNVGGMRGLEGIYTGPRQAQLELMDPQGAREFTDWVNQRYEPYQALMGKYPWTTKAGEILGYTSGMIVLGMATRGLSMALPMGPMVANAVSKVPAIIRAGVGGGVAGGLSFNEDPDSASRVVETVVGSVFGEFGLGLAKAVGWGLRVGAESKLWRGFQENLKEMVGHISEGELAMKQAFADYYERITREKNLKYTVRNKAGEAIQGYPSKLVEGGGVAELLDDIIKGRRIEEPGGTSAKAEDVVRATAAKIENTMEIDAQRKEMKEAEDAIKAWEDKKAKGDAIKGISLGTQGTGTLADLERIDPVGYAATRKRLELLGSVPPAGDRPADFVARPIPAKAYSDARVEVGAAIRRTRNARARQQLNVLKRKLDETMGEAARDAGIPVSKFKRLMDEADAYNRKTFAPAQKLAGGKTVSEYRADDDITNFTVYNKWVNVVKSPDREAQARMAAALGPEGSKARTAASLAVQHDMFMAATKGRGENARFDPTAVRDYIQLHIKGIEQALGPKEATRLQGIANIAEKLGKESRRDPRMFAFHHPFMLLAAASHGLFSGNWEHALGTAGGLLALTVVENVARMVRINPRLDVLLPRAAKADPEGPEMQQILRSIDMVFRAGARGTARTTAPEVGGGEQGRESAMSYRYLGAGR